MVRRLFYATPSGADLIGAHQAFRRGDAHHNQVSRTFSGLVEAFCERRGIAALMTSGNPDGRTLDDGAIRLEHRPRRVRGGGLAYHASLMAEGLSLLSRARRFGAEVAVLDIGTTHAFVMPLFVRAGIRVIPVLHNTLWPAGFPPSRPVPRLVQSLDRRFWRSGPAAVIGVSPECIRQMETLAPDAGYPRLVALAQFDRAYFDRMPPPPPHEARPFEILFVGRAERSKGLLDLVPMAQSVEARAPGTVRWTVCGDGPNLPALRAAVAAAGLEPVFDIAGWTPPDALAHRYAAAHAVIVPTRSGFAEGMAMTAVEAVCAGRPLVTNTVVPAAEVLAPACLVARPDDPASHADAVLRLATDGALYDRLRAACASVREPFFDPARGLDRMLDRAFDEAGL